MTVSDIEVRLRAALQDHAEEAMNRTNTDAELNAVVDRTASGTSSGRRLVVSAVAVAAASALIIAGLLLWPGTDDDATDPAGPDGSIQDPTQAMAVANDFLTAWSDFDRAAAAEYLADGVDLGDPDGSGEATWQVDNQWWQATGLDAELQACSVPGTGGDSVTVYCRWTGHQFGSEQLGRGPYGDNVFMVDVADGEVVRLAIETSHLANGFDDEMWGPFFAWLTNEHPGDEKVLNQYEQAGATDADVAESLALWQERVSEYVAAVRAGEAE